MIKYTFYGTSHGEGYGGEISGLPCGFAVDTDYVNVQLARRKCGYGRSPRQNELPDKVIFSGLSDGKIVGKLSFFVPNAANYGDLPEITALRSGHVDVVAYETSGIDSIRQANERASGRSSVCYVVLGAVCKQILEKCGITTSSRAIEIGGVSCEDVSAVKKVIDSARSRGDSLGGIVEITADGVPVGLGDCFPYDRRLNGKIAAALSSIPSVKAVEFGLGTGFAAETGVSSNDKLQLENGKLCYRSNNGGGITAGISDGRQIVVRLTVKPVPTVKGVVSVDVATGKAAPAYYERADTCVAETVGVIAGNMLATTLLEQILSENKLEGLLK